MARSTVKKSLGAAVRDDDLPQIALLVKALDEKKAGDIVVLDLRNQSSYLNYFVIATALSRAHLRTLFDEVHKTAVEHGFERPRPQLPQFESGWVTYDFGFYVVHLFEEEKRKFYNLELIWKQAAKVDFDEKRSHPSEIVQAERKKIAAKPESFTKKTTTIKKKTIKEKKMATKKKPAKKKAAKKKAAKKKK